jgi:hypothetical protein
VLCAHLNPYETTPKSRAGLSSSKLGAHTLPLRLSVSGTLLPLMFQQKVSSKVPSRSDSSLTRITWMERKDALQKGRPCFRLPGSTVPAAEGYLAPSA